MAFIYYNWIFKREKYEVFYRGSQSSIKSLPGGGPQGTLLALLLFLVLVNDVGYENQVNNAGEVATSRKKIKAANQIHLKFVDDLTLAEAELPSKMASQSANLNYLSNYPKLKPLH